LEVLDVLVTLFGGAKLFAEHHQFIFVTCAVGFGRVAGQTNYQKQGIHAPNQTPPKHACQVMKPARAAAVAKTRNFLSERTFHES